MEEICSAQDCSGKAVTKGFCQRHYDRYRRKGDNHLIPKHIHGAPLKWLRAHSSYKNDDCLIWPFGKMTVGYGAIHLDGVMMAASRAMCILTHGAPLHKQQAAHSCGNRACVNPAHIRWATPKENQADRLIDGTHNRGEMRRTAKLTEFDVLAIRGSRALPRSWLAKKYNVTAGYITAVLNDVTWNWL